MSTEHRATLSDWYRFVRRARFADARKIAVTLMVGTYASNDGTSVKCGVARLAVDCEIGYSTARRYLAWMREVGLIELVRAGSPKAKRPDEYQLTIGPETEKVLSALAEDEYRDLIDGVKATNRDGEKVRRLRSPKASADSAPESANEPPSALTPGVSAEARGGVNSSALNVVSADGRYLRSPMGELQPPSKRSPPTGDAPSPDPWRRPPPSASAIDEQKSPSDSPTPAQDQQRNSLPHEGAIAPAEHLATITPIDLWRTA
jgi:hypothetical protein